MKNVFRFLFFLSMFSVVTCTSQLLAQLVQMNGPYGGVVNCITSNGQGALFVGTNSGLFRSTNDGKSWEIVSMGYLSAGPIMQVFALQAVDSTVFAATNMDLFVSTDEGSTWSFGPGHGSVATIKEYIVNVRNVAWAENFGGHYVSINVCELDSTFHSFEREVGTYFSANDLSGTTYIQALAFNGSMVLAGTSHGVCMSSDTGETWISSDSGLTDENVQAVAISAGRILAGTDSAGIFYSIDSGRSWSPCNSGLTTLSIKSIAVNGNNIYAGTNGGEIFLSTDSGTSWTSISSGLSNPVINTIGFDGNTPIAGTNGCGVFSFDGTTWIPINSGLCATFINAFTVNGSNLFAATDGGGVYLSTNDGSSWTAVNSGLTNLHVQSLVTKGDNLFAGTLGGGIFLSTNNGTSWVEANSGITEMYIHSLVVSGNNLLAGTCWPGNLPIKLTSAEADSGKIFLSTDNGNSWTVTESGLLIVEALAAIDSDVFAAGHLFLYGSTDNGKSWAMVSSVPSANSFPVEVLTFAVSGKNLFAGTYGNGIYLSTDRSTSWTQISSGLSNFWGLAFNVPALATIGDNVFSSIIEYDSPTIGLEEGGGVFLSINNGTSWNVVESGFTINGNFGPYEPAVCALSISNNTLFAGTNGLGVWKESIPDIIASIPPSIMLSQSSVAFGSVRDDSAKSVTLRIANGSPNPLIIDSVYTGTKWFAVATMSDTITNGDTLRFGVTFTPDTAKAYSDTLYILNNSSIFLTKVPLSGNGTTTGTLQNHSGIPKNYGISQNYPNPFNPTTIIKYQLPVSSHVTLKVYDILGREVATLINEKQNAGYYNTVFNASDLPSGVYIYKLQAGTYSEPKKLVLLK